jgi:hypothetical protein
MKKTCPCGAASLAPPGPRRCRALRQYCRSRCCCACKPQWMLRERASRKLTPTRPPSRSRSTDRHISRARPEWLRPRPQPRRPIRPPDRGAGRPSVARLYPGCRSAARRCGRATKRSRQPRLSTPKGRAPGRPSAPAGTWSQTPRPSAASHADLAPARFHHRCPAARLPLARRTPGRPPRRGQIPTARSPSIAPSQRRHQTGPRHRTGPFRADPSPSPTRLRHREVGQPSPRAIRCDRRRRLRRNWSRPWIGRSARGLRHRPSMPPPRGQRPRHDRGQPLRVPRPLGGRNDGRRQSGQVSAAASAPRR